ncbi:hypothetical protein RhiirA5_356384 [Rhizophagus irregularis]|uniref:Uncharacterized protein n=2 Tax=Rhizophagus irregularis TaxID=588596 RepID=A0A2I1E6F7_9GLOM|nr:hypothetical protein RhiirA5_356384 [Rhizophagus irregularis]PKC65627.1 hypothetical protein RhiirA1_420249 [Rhizophagus irregularis]PKK74019.1 hypothetical protein RhiirC2_739601 [Rhizophagus irregularis]PKK77502.1 hypothetical protein RhiirC2_731830 [Rhizophagus irregularis]PKY17703.1 hypothetical protein RhiirB3_404632 [Rhizophagus irregularis]
MSPSNDMPSIPSQSPSPPNAIRLPLLSNTMQLRYHQIHDHHYHQIQHDHHH